METYKQFPTISNIKSHLSCTVDYHTKMVSFRIRKQTTEFARAGKCDPFPSDVESSVTWQKVACGFQSLPTHFPTGGGSDAHDGSMGLVYLPTWMVDFDGKCGTWTSPMDGMGSRMFSFFPAADPPAPSCSWWQNQCSGTTLRQAKCQGVEWFVKNIKNQRTHLCMSYIDKGMF